MCPHAMLLQAQSQINFPLHLQLWLIRYHLVHPCTLGLLSKVQLLKKLYSFIHEEISAAMNDKTMVSTFI